MYAIKPADTVVCPLISISGAIVICGLLNLLLVCSVWGMLSGLFFKKLKN
jgi:hypothetical protein